MKKKILFIHPKMSEIRQLMEQVEHDAWHNVYVTSVSDALKRLSNVTPDIVFLDVDHEPEVALKMLQLLKETPKYGKTLVLASMSDSFFDEFYEWEKFAIDEIILKPLTPRKLNLRIRKMLHHHAREQSLAKEIAHKMTAIENLKDAVIVALGSINEYRDNETHGHACRTQFYVKEIAKELRRQGHYQELLDDTYIELLYKSAPLHDIGKIGISESILLKKTKLSDAEFEIIKEHTSIGERIIASIISQVGSTEFLQCAMEIAGSHHERWDGTGYPRGIDGEVIPLSARMMCIADAYDALTSNRVYRSPLSHEKAVEIICLGKGSYFDPVIVDVFVTLADKFKAYARQQAD